MIKIGLTIDDVEGEGDDDLPALVDTPTGNETNTKMEEVD